MGRRLAKRQTAGIIRTLKYRHLWRAPEHNH
jgi:hypothetical protein